MLTADDGSRDGGNISYLRSPEKWERFDPDLYAGLSALLQLGPARQVSLIESSKLLPRTSYYSAAVPDGRDERDVWRTGMLDAASGVDLVFVDPDNGIEIPSKPVGRKGSSKYVTWKELQELWDAGCSLLIYQHFRREPREAFAARMASELRRRTGAPFTEALRTAHVLFLLVAQAEHEALFRKAISDAATPWEGQITVMGLANKAMQRTGCAGR
jgi:hypothetical protein